MATLGQIFQSLEEQRKAAPQKSPLADSLNSLSKALSVMQKGIASLGDTIQAQRTAQGAARNLAQADDVKEKIRTLLELKVSEDKIERDRHQRMMEIAEGVVPQITDEQLETIREQRKAYREQQWALKEELRIAEETAKVQKESSKAIADAETADGVEVQLNGSTCFTILNEGALVKVARLLVGSDDAIHRGVFRKHGARLHGKDVTNGVNRSYRQVLDRRFGILFLAGGEHQSHHGKKHKDVEYSVFHFIVCFVITF